MKRPPKKKHYEQERGGERKGKEKEGVGIWKLSNCTPLG
jgi:hypothetical protein